MSLSSVARPAGPLPRLPGCDLAPLPARRGARRCPLPRGSFSSRPRAGCPRGGAPGDGRGHPGGYRSGGASPAGRITLRRPRARPRSRDLARRARRTDLYGLPAFGEHFFPALGGGGLWRGGRVGRRCRLPSRARSEGMGMGDVKMIAMIGAFVGPGGVFLTLFAASVTGTVIAGLPALLRSLSWRAAFSRSRSSAERAREEAVRHGLLVGRDGRIAAAGPRWKEIPGAPSEGEPLSPAGPVARPVAAFARLALRRAASGVSTSFGRLAVEDETGDFFRVLAARGEAVPGGILLLLSTRGRPVRRLPRGGFGRRLGNGAASLSTSSRAGSPFPGRGLLPATFDAPRPPVQGWILRSPAFRRRGPRLRPLPRRGVAPWDSFRHELGPPPERPPDGSRDPRGRGAERSTLDLFAGFRRGSARRAPAPRPRGAPGRGLRRERNAPVPGGLPPAAPRAPIRLEPQEIPPGDLPLLTRTRVGETPLWRPRSAWTGVSGCSGSSTTPLRSPRRSG